MSDILDLTVRELLEEYGIMYSPECAYTYGIVAYEDSNKLFETYDLDEQDSVAVESIISDEVEDMTPLTYEKLEYIMRNLGFKKRGEHEGQGTD